MRRFLRTLCFLAVWPIFSVEVCADDIEKLLRFLEARAVAASSIKWQFESMSLKGVPLSELLQIDPAGNPVETAHSRGVESFLPELGTSFRGSGLEDFRSGRYKIEFVHKEQGSEKIESRAISFNGSIYSSLMGRHEGNGAEFGRTSKASVQLSKEDSSAPNTFMIRYWAGEGFLPGAVPLIRGALGFQDSFVPLSDFISAVRKQKADVQFKVRSANAWVLDVPIEKKIELNGYVQFVFDPRTTGGVVSVSWMQEEPLATEQYLVENIEWANGVHGPSKVLHLDWLNGKGAQWTFSDATVTPSLEPSDFSLNLPVGAVVHDHVRKMAYSVSTEPVEESAAMARYAQTAAVKKPSAVSSGLSRFWFVGGSLLFLAIVGLVVWRKRRDSLLAIAIVMLTISQFGC